MHINLLILKHNNNLVSFSFYLQKKLFIESHSSHTYRLFLDWFVETAMFQDFVHHKYSNEHGNGDDATLYFNVDSNFYDWFDARLMEKSENKCNTTQQDIDTIVRNSRVINKKAKLFKRTK